MSTARSDEILSRIWIVQAGYDLITGIWGIIGIRSFQKVTGPKTDIWLVKTVAVLVFVIGGVIASAGARRKMTPEIAALAIGTNATLATIDVVYTAQGRISRVYLLDALMGSALNFGWGMAIRRKALRLAS